MNNIMLSRFYLLLDEIQSELKSYEMTDLKFYSSIVEGRTKGLSKEFPLLISLFPSLSIEDLKKLIIFMKMMGDQYSQEKIDIVGTLPMPIPNVRKTVGVVRQLLNEANGHILLTGYAISEYFNDIFDLVLAKNANGVCVDLFVDDNNHVSEFLKRLNEKTHQINIYKYQGKESYSSLHAKVLLVDYQKAFVSSSNLSYNGIVNNLELGTLITGKKVTVLRQIFDELLSEGYFKKII